jgi:hypothetical protein
MAVMLILDLWHPHHLPVTVLLLVFLIAGGALIVGGGARTVFGPQRLRALTCLLLGLAPLLFFAGHVLYGLRVGYSRNLRLDMPLKVLVPFGESFADFLTRFVYPVRTAGATVVMIAGPTPGAAEQVALMDQHVKRLWGRLGGLSTTRRVHWVRGPLLGMEARAVHSVCLGSRADQSSNGGRELSTLDRHEVAHCVLSSFMPADVEPPSVLSEGWAQANQGDDESALAANALESHERGQWIPLRDLTGPDWYSRHLWPAYLQGAPLVNYILREHGPEKFLELYRTCRPTSFAEDCKRVLGQTVDELEAGYLATVIRTAAVSPKPAVVLRSLKVRPPVDRMAWSAFVEDYVAAARALTAPYQDVSMTIERIAHGEDEPGKSTTTTDQLRYQRPGDLIAFRGVHPQSQEACLATPAQSFRAFRRDAHSPWEISDRPGEDQALAYHRVARHIAEADYFISEAAALFSLASEKQFISRAKSLYITEFERFDDAGHGCLRLRIEDTDPTSAPWQSVTMALVADERFAMRSSDTMLRDGSHVRAKLAYDHESGVPVLRSLEVKYLGRDDKTRDTSMTVIDRRFGPVPPSEFTEERILDGPVVHTHSPPDDALFKEPENFTAHYRVSLVAGAVAMAAGLLCGLLGGFRRSTAIEPPARSPQPG